MAKMLQKSLVFACFFVIFTTDICRALDNLVPKDAKVHRFSMDRVSEEVESHVVNKRSTRHRRGADARCDRQEKDFLSELKKEDIIDSHNFLNETNYSMALAWAGENDGVILVAATEETFGFATQSHLYRSENAGKLFTDINEKINNDYIRKDYGLQKHTHQPQTVFVVCHSSDDPTRGLMYRTTNGGKDFTKIRTDFLVGEEFVFHPDPDMANYILVRSNTKDLYVSANNGETWEKIKENIQNFKWSTMEGERKAIYAVHDKTSIYNFFDIDNELIKSSNLGQNWLTIKESVYTFGMQGHFLFASILMEETDERLMVVSTDGGKTWAEAQLPSITEDRFYSILDMSEDMIFMHVDNPGDTGHGILYTSDKMGVIFAESLTNHLYPNYVELTDFYKVASMRGTYLASQLSDDDQSIHTVISFDRGAEWQHVPRPVGAPCKDESKACHLQIHNMYSRSRGIKANTPLSVPTAPGIILVHGHVADSLQTTEPDVFVTSDGGYTWSLALNGPHHYQIADQGGLLVAVPSDTPTPNIVKFSTDEGRCWHEYTFTNETVVMTGLLTEPGNKAMSVAIFGYGQEDRMWRTFVVDFEKAIPSKCIETDYESWTPHSDSSKLNGCLLGKKETFQRLKKDSWCKNGHSYDTTPQATEFCACTKLDYECDYGYSRDVGSELCTKDEAFVGPEIDICLRGHEEKLVTQGYRRIPGDVCQGGFSPQGDKLIDMKKRCEEGSKEVVEEDMGIVDPEQQIQKEREAKTRTSFVLVAAVMGTIVVSLVVLAFIVKKYRLMKRVPHIRYGALRTTDPDMEHLIDENLGNTTSLYEDDSDEDDAASKRGGGGVFVYGNKQVSPPSSSWTAINMPGAGRSYGGTSQSPPASSPPANGAPPAANGVSRGKPRGAPQPKVKAYHDDSDEFVTVGIQNSSSSDEDMLE